MNHHLTADIDYQFLREEPGLVEPQEPTRPYLGDAGWDLYASRDQTLGPGQIRNIHTDIAMAIPNGYFGRIVSRSSTYNRTGLHILGGVIDAGYRGEMFILALNPGDKKIEIERGDRVAQLLVHPVPTVVFHRVDRLSRSQRGEASFGSSGR